MGAFSSGMRRTAQQLMTKLGNSCVLTKVDRGAYDPATGKTSETRTDYPTYSAQTAKTNVVFGLTGENTNLDAFDDESVVVPWIGEEINPTWLYNGQNITEVHPVMSQDEIIIYILSIGEKK